MQHPELDIPANPRPRKRARLLARALVPVAVAAGALFAVPPTAALATPSDCAVVVDQWGQGGYGSTRCTFGTGYYRVVVTCAYQPSDRLHYLYYGSWYYPSSGAWSWRSCPSDQYILGAGVQTSG